MIPPTPSPATRLPPLRPSRLPSTVSALRYLCASEKRAGRVVSVFRLTRPHARGPSVETRRPAVRLRAALAAAAACVQRARDPSALCSRGGSHSSHMPQAMGGVPWGPPGLGAPQRGALDEAAADDADELEAGEPPAARAVHVACGSRHRLPQGGAPRRKQPTRGGQPVVGRRGGGPQADATRGRREADDDARYRRERARLREGCPGRV